MEKRMLSPINWIRFSTPLSGESTLTKFVLKYKKRFSKVLICLGLPFAVCFVLSGCKTGGLSLGLSGMKNQVVANTLSEMPNDAARVISEVGGLMTGNQPSHAVILDSETLAAIISGGAREPGFVMTDAKLFHYDSSSDTNTRQIFAIAEFENPTGCRWKEEIKAQYQIEKIAIKVLEITTEPVFEENPEAVCFIVPADKIVAIKNALPPTFGELYQNIAEQAVIPKDARTSKEAEDWGMVVFFLDRISPSASTRLSISADRNGIDGYSKESRYADYSGWRVGFVAGRFLLKGNNADQELYLKAIFTPGSEAGFIKNTTVVGLYSLAQ